MDDISPETLFFDNTVQRKGQLEKNWCVEAGKTWLNKYFKAAHKRIEVLAFGLIR